MSIELGQVLLPGRSVYFGKVLILLTCLNRKNRLLDFNVRTLPACFIRPTGTRVASEQNPNELYRYKNSGEHKVSVRCVSSARTLRPPTPNFDLKGCLYFSVFEISNRGSSSRYNEPHREGLFNLPEHWHSNFGSNY